MLISILSDTYMTATRFGGPGVSHPGDRPREFRSYGPVTGTGKGASLVASLLLATAMVAGLGVF
jgi:hypothetical protein